MESAGPGYALASRPPPGVLLAAAAQHMGLMAVTLVFPLLVAQEAGADPQTQARYLALAMVAMGVSTLLQCWGGRIFSLPVIGSGFLLPAVFTAAYLPAALIAARAGGLDAVAGLTIAAGVSQIAISRVMGRLKPFLPIEIVGLVVMMIGIILGDVAFKLIVGYGGGRTLTLDGTGAAVVALCVMIGLAVWGGARLRVVAVLFGLIAGTLFYLAVGAGGGSTTFAAPAPFTLIAWPLVSPRFDVALLPGFLAGALASTLRGFGDMVASQRANDPDWKRPDYANVSSGVLADGLGTLCAGLIGTMGLNTYSASVGLSVATKVRARRVGLWVGVGWIALALIPGSTLVVEAIPRAVLGAALLFASTYIVLSGITILGQRLLDARRTLVVGLGFLLGISFDLLPAFYAEVLPPALRAVVSSSLMLGLFTALALNALFRIGARRSHRMAWEAAGPITPLRRFIREAGAAEGARAEAVERLVLIADEFATAARSVAQGAVQVTAAFDEHQMEIGFAYSGRRLEPGPPLDPDPFADDEAALNGITFAFIVRLSDAITQRDLPDGRQELVCTVEV